VIKDKFGDRLDQWIHTIFPFLFKWKVDPNLLTALGAVVCVGAAVAFGMGEFRIGALLLMLGGVCDLVDGVVARHFGNSTAFGAFLDSTLDRLVDMAVLLGLVLHYALAGDATMALVAGIGMVSSVLTSYTKARAEAIDVELDGGSIVERGERVALLIAGGLFGVMQIALWVLAVGATATVVQRFTSARRVLAAQDEERATRPSAGEQLLHGD
jgi:phosphatidylglycerophosphate synthase